MQLRWGICGAGMMSFDFANTLAIAPDRHIVRAVAARELSRAEQVAQAFNIPKAYGSYAELAQDSEVDVVYVGTVNNTHFELCKLYLEAGKAVLCEKALCCGQHQAAALVELARTRRVFLMEGIWSRTLPAYDKLRELLAENVIGPVRAVETRLLLDRSQVDRINEPSIGGGVTWFTGVYGLGLIDTVFADTPLQRVHAVGAVQNGVDTNVCANLQFSDGRFASMFHSATINGELAAGHLSATVFGDSGHIQLSIAFPAPHSVVVTSRAADTKEVTKTKFEFDYPRGPLKANYFETGGLLYEADHVRECLSKGALESPLVPLESSLRIQKIIDAIRAELGLNPLEALPIPSS